MIQYEQMIEQQLDNWTKDMIKPSSFMARMSKQVQTKVQELIPEKAHAVLTETIKKMLQAIVVGSDFIQPKLKDTSLTLQERDERTAKKIEDYKKIAAVEGAGTGAGGILLGLADFPLLITIKIKFLFDAATLYGYDTSKEEERLFILHVFQLAFSSDDHRREIFETIENWDEVHKQVDWRKLQQEYRDYIDLAKMLQLVPVIGAPVGAYANYQLMNRLGEITMNCYRMRWLKEKQERL